MSEINVRFKINGEFFDSYQTESIDYVQKVQDFSKVDTNYSDHSLIFSIPATIKNLRLIQFYNDKNNNETFNPLIGSDIEMWLNQEFFSEGVMQLVSIDREKREPVNIQIQYFADVTNLKAALRRSDGEDSTLADVFLDNNFYTHQTNRDDMLRYLSGEPVLNLDGNDTGLVYPMASQDNLWRWQNQPFEGQRRIHVGAQNLGYEDIGILFTETRPAIKVLDVIGKIFELAGVTNPKLSVYDIKFFDQNYFADLYMWIANGESWDNTVYTTKVVRTDYNMSDPSRPDDPPFTRYRQFFGLSKIEDSSNAWNNSTGEYFASVSGDFVLSFSINQPDTITRQINFKYQDNQPTAPVVQVGPIPIPQGVTIVGLTEGARFWDFQISSGDDPFNQRYPYDFTTTITPDPPLRTPDNYSITQFMPEMTCADFILGILKTFNAVLYWDKDNLKWVITHKPTWYADGNTVDLTPFIDTDKDSIRPPAMIRNYDFKFDEAEDYLSLQYLEAGQNISFGQLKYATNRKYGEDYDLKNPFTSPIWQEIVSLKSNNFPIPDFNTEIPSFQVVNPAGDPKQSGARLMYLNGIGVTAGGTYTTADDLGFNPTGTNRFNKFTSTCNGQGVQLSYKPEYSWEITVPQNPVITAATNLFNAFYLEFMSGIYDQSTRRYKFSCYLPYHLIKLIRMNDTIKIGANEYLINTIETKYLTGRVELDLMDKIDYNPVSIPTQ